MFDRAIKDLEFIKRWGITRNIRDQSVSEHSFGVAAYANDICVFFGLDANPAFHRDILQYAIWHDLVDETITGDMPGPNKRVLIADAAFWKSSLAKLSERLFGPGLAKRTGLLGPADYQTTVKLVIKVADWLEAAIDSATEMQMGNLNREVHFIHDSEECIKSATALAAALDRTPFEFVDMIKGALSEARWGQSKGPVMADEMYHATQIRNENSRNRYERG